VRCVVFVDKLKWLSTCTKVCCLLVMRETCSVQLWRLEAGDTLVTLLHPRADGSFLISKHASKPTNPPAHLVSQQQRMVRCK
jgi:hypothetical protein